MVSTAKKNPLENHSRSIELRLTGDDLPMARNRVDLDPRYVDEYGLPVARITRDFGPAEREMFELTKSMMEGVLSQEGCVKQVSTPGKPDKLVLNSKDAMVDLIGDHQMGTCRMGRGPGDLGPGCALSSARLLKCLRRRHQLHADRIWPEPDGHSRCQCAARGHLDRSASPIGPISIEKIANHVSSKRRMRVWLRFVSPASTGSG
jgi:GMC oxidoreductase